MKRTFTTTDLPGIAREIIASLPKSESATVVALSGELGAGKTTLTQEVAKALGISSTVISPTFVIMKEYELPRAECARGFETLIHIDAYRLNSSTELEKLGWQERLDNPKNLILIEWPERVQELIPSGAKRIALSHVREDEREIEIGE